MCLYCAFARHVAARPHAPAVLSGSATLSFHELDERASAVALRLRARGLAPGSLIGLHLRRSADLVVGILGILRAGFAYVPLDVSFPEERLRYIVRDAGLSLVVGRDADFLKSLFDLSVLDIAAGDVQSDYITLPHVCRPTEAVATVLYTSGSTGRPKGVVLSHGALVARIHHGYACRDGDIQKASVSTIGHISDLLLPLATGIPVRVVTDTVSQDLTALGRALHDHGTTRVVLVPSHLRAILNAGERVTKWFRRIDTVIVGGEALTPPLAELFRRAMPWARLVNGYGTTEIAGLIAVGDITCSTGITVGRECPGSQVFVFDDELRPAAAGVPGDIFVASLYLASGYLHDPVLTAERFVANPFSDEGGRMYRTGDLGRWTGDGTLELLGRQDDILKVRGQRVHRGEIERAIESHPSVSVAVVTTDIRHDGRERLVAFVRWAGGDHDAKALYEHLRTVLPVGMLPNDIRTADEIPTLPGGKIDRLQLTAGHSVHELAATSR